MSAAVSESLIRVSKERTSFFYKNIAIKYLKDNHQVEISGLGLALTTAISVAELLKAAGLVDIARIQTGLAKPGNIFESKNKASISIFLRKTPDFDQVYEKSLVVEKETKELRDKIKHKRIESQKYFKNLTAEGGN